MTQSLQDQLVQAGLADEKRAREVRKDKTRKRNKQPKRARGQGPGQGRQQAESRAAQQQAQKADRDRQIEQRRQEKRRAKETADQIRQIVDRHRVDRSGGEAVYRFTQGSRIKEVRVTDRQRQQVARGELAIVAAARGYHLVPPHVAERIGALDPSAVRVANERGPSAADPEDPYAAFPVPDDLVW